jgi:hypothetical protein
VKSAACVCVGRPTNSALSTDSPKSASSVDTKLHVKAGVMAEGFAGGEGWR